MGDSFIPTSLGCSSSAELLWTITGVSKLHGSDHDSLACVRVLSGFKKTIPDAAGPELTLLDDNEVPGAEKLLEKLQGSVTVEEEVFLAAAEAVKTSMCNLLIKKQYTTEKREFRKRGRNDKKTKQWQDLNIGNILATQQILGRYPCWNDFAAQFLVQLQLFTVQHSHKEK